MGPGAGPTPREEEQREAGRRGGSVLDHSALPGGFGKASGESSARVACEVPRVPETGPPQWPCCAQASAGTGHGERAWPWSQHGDGLHSAAAGTRGHLGHCGQWSERCVFMVDTLVFQTKSERI